MHYGFACAPHGPALVAPLDHTWQSCRMSRFQEAHSVSAHSVVSRVPLTKSRVVASVEPHCDSYCARLEPLKTTSKCCTRHAVSCARCAQSVRPLQDP